MADKFFPIKTDTACQLKWSWSTLYLSQKQTASCHRTGWGELDEENFDQFHNTDKKLQERKDMLAGRWPEHSCHYCRKIEQAGGFSDRKLMLSIPNQYPEILDTDPTAIHVDPTVLEVFVNNVCNMSCLYCIPGLSSKINQENIKFGKFNKGGVILEAEENQAPILIDKFWDYMKRKSSGLKRFNVLGGEPFYQPEFYQLLDYFENTAHPNLELGISTNLQINSSKLELICEKFRKLLVDRKLKRIDLTCSIDCWGPEQEFVRYGLNLATWEKNFEYLLQQKWITLNINQAISILTIKTMPKLLIKLQNWRKTRPVGHFFSSITPQPSYLVAGILGGNTFKSDFDKIISCMPEDTEQHKIAKIYMQGIIKEIEQSEVDIAEIDKLQIFLDEKDRRRGTDWKTMFPWLAEICDQHLKNNSDSVSRENTHVV